MHINTFSKCNAISCKFFQFLRGCTTLNRYTFSRFNTFSQNEHFHYIINMYEIESFSFLEVAHTCSNIFKHYLQFRLLHIHFGHFAAFSMFTKLNEFHYSSFEESMSNCISIGAKYFRKFKQNLRRLMFKNIVKSVNIFFQINVGTAANEASYLCLIV